MNNHLRLAIQYLQRGGVVAHACKGVWGIACDPWNEFAVDRVLSIKKRPKKHGLIVIAHDSNCFSFELSRLTDAESARIADSWPGHVTWLLPSTRFPEWITGLHSTVAARVPDHLQARQLCEGFGGPLVSTSANVSNEPAAKTAEQVASTIGHLVDMIIPGATNGASSASKIFTVDGDAIR